MRIASDISCVDMQGVGVVCGSGRDVFGVVHVCLAEP